MIWCLQARAWQSHLIPKETAVHIHRQTMTIYHTDCQCARQPCFNKLITLCSIALSQKRTEVLRKEPFSRTYSVRLHGLRCSGAPKTAEAMERERTDALLQFVKWSREHGGSEECLSDRGKGWWKPRTEQLKAQTHDTAHNCSPSRTGSYSCSPLLHVYLNTRSSSSISAKKNFFF